MKRKIFKILTTFVLLSTLIGTVGALNGWFGGGGKIPEDTFTRGLVAYWSFDEGSGTTAYDASGNGNHGTIYGAKWTNGKIGGALSFDGVNDWVGISRSWTYYASRLDQSTWIVWFKINALPPPGYWYKVFGSDVHDMSVFIASNGRIGFRHQYNAYLYSNYYASIGEWIFFAVSVKYLTPTQIAYTLFVNGNITNGTYSGTNLNLDRSYSGYHIGSHVLYYGVFFNGTIDEVRIYNRALSPEEIRFHYSRGGPVAYWKFDEGKGTKVYDLSGNNNHGTLDLGTSGNIDPSKAWVPGKFGQALSFDGVDDYVGVPNSASLNIADSITVEAWVNLATLNQSPFPGIIQKGAVDINNITTFIVFRNSDKKFFFGWKKDGVWYQVFTPTETVANQWVHVVGTFDGTTIRIYRNGVLSESKIAPKPALTTSSLIIGRYSTDYFNGIIDEVRIYNYARTPDEIRLDYNAGYAARFGPSTDCNSDPGSCMTKGLVAYWSFDEGSGNIAYDSSGNGNHGTLINGPKWTQGKIGGALSFDGVDETVRVSDSPSLRLRELSVAMWLKLPTQTGMWRRVIEKGSYNAEGYRVLINAHNPNLIGWHIFDDGASATREVWTSYTPDTWFFFVGVVKNGFMGLYINGELKAWRTDVTGARLGTGNVGIGSNWFGTENTIGLIDEVRIYNRALSEEEIRYHYNHTLPKGALSPLAMKEDPSLVGYWSFNEGKGAIINDQSGNNNNGTLYLGSSGNTDPSKAWSPGISGTALSFDGVDDYVNVSDSINLRAVPFTVEFWINLRSWATYKRIIGKGDGYYISGGWHVETIGNNFMFYWNYDRSAFDSLVASSVTIEANRWYHVVAIHTGSRAYIYVNGIAHSKSTTLTPTGTPGYPVQIGGTTYSGQYINGTIDEVRIYNRALSEQEILEHYRNSKYYLASHFGPKTNCREDPGSCIDYGLVGYWSFDEGAGTTAYDASGKGNNGTLVNGPKWTNGKFGGALSFDGVDDKVQVPVSSSLTNFTQKSVVFWLKPNRYPSVWEPYDNGYWTSPYGDLFQNIGTSLIYYLRNTAGTAVSLGYGIPSSLQYQWIMVATSWDGSTVKLYVNAQLVNSRSFSGTLACSSYPLTLGSRYNGQYPFNGLIDEVRIYNRALSEEEIRYLYNRGAPIAHWKFDEGEGNIAYDSSGNGNNGTLVNGPTWVPGKFASALKFDGVDDYVEVPSNVSLSWSNNSGSLSFWVKSNGNQGDYTALVFKGVKGGGGAFNEFEYQTYLIGGKLEGRISNGSTANLVRTSYSYNTDFNWHFVAMTVSDKLRLYFDGSLVSEVNRTINIWNANQPFRIAGGGITVSYFNGLIDDVRIYNYARSPEQILQDYNAGLATHFK